MTKSIRIENADTSNHKIRVWIEELHTDGTWHRHHEPLILDYPTQMIERVVYKERRLVIEEVSE